MRPCKDLEDKHCMLAYTIIFGIEGYKTTIWIYFHCGNNNNYYIMNNNNKYIYPQWKCISTTFALSLDVLFHKTD